LIAVAAAAILAPVARSAGGVYVVNGSDSSLSQYEIGVGGSLTAANPATLATPRALSIAVTPDGRSAYIPNCCGVEAVSQYNVDPLTGGLSPKSPAFVPSAALEAGAIAVTPDGRSAYVTNGSIGSAISEYSIDPITGALSPKTPASVGSGGARAIAVTPDGKNAYVLSANMVVEYSIDPTTGRADGEASGHR
jgi:6-phosphogluconolactonase